MATCRPPYRRTFFTTCETPLLHPLGFVRHSGLCSQKPETAQALKEKITESVYASGTIKSKKQHQAFAAVGRLVQKVLVQEGDLVNVSFG